MAQCTAPIREHRTAAACTLCGVRRSNYHSYGYPSYSSYLSGYSNSIGGSSRSSSGGSKRKAKWSPPGSRVYYTEAQIRSLTPIHETIIK